MRYSCAYSVVILLELASLLRHASLESASYRERCPRPHLKNGWVKIRSHGRVAKFNCAREFQLLGEKFATCLGGEWDNPTPLCVRPGCEPLELSNGQMMATYRGAVVTFFCNPGYRLEGIAKLYCDGKTWNGTAPQCTALSKEPAVQCDFETEDLCGWTQDPHHHFNWTRLNHNTPSGSVGTGPSYDHTLGKGKDGYYLYIETSGPRKQNDTARLYSPVYGTEVVAAQPSCFIFWYHMYGATVGSLAVYIKPDNMELTDDLEAGFFQSGNKGDVWRNGVVNIPPIGVPFQIIIEGVRGPGYVGDTAIDDVRLANGSDCEQATTDVPLMTTYATQDDGQSCHLRCNVGEEATPSTCDCHPSCRISNTCCEDYAFYCMHSSSTRPSRTFPTPPPLPPLEPHPLESSTISSETSEQVFKPIPIPPDPTPLILNLPTTPSTSTSTTAIKPIVTATTKTTTTTTTKSPTTKTTTTTTTITPTTKTITRPTTKTTTTTTRRPTTKTTTTTTTIRPTTKTTTTTTTITPTTKTTTTTTTITPTTTTITPTTKTITRPTTKTTTTTTARRPTTKTTTTTVKEVMITKTTVNQPIVVTISTTTSSTPKSRPTVRTINVSTSKPRITTATVTKSSTWRTNTMRSVLDNDIQGKEWNIVPREPLMQSEQSVPISLIAGITVLVATVAVVSVVVSIFIRQRRKSRSQQNLAEDSDVRFLTADEILDFTLARPREEDEDSN